MVGITLKRFQEDAVDFLFNKTTDITSKQKIIMQSPTGSGKTIILIAYIEKYLELYKDSEQENLFEMLHKAHMQDLILL